MRILLWIVGIIAVLIGAAFLFLGDPEVPRDVLMQKYGQAPSQFVDLPSGAKAHYRDQGNAAGPALVLLHGSNASLHTWEPWVKNSRRRVSRGDGRFAWARPDDREGG